MDGQSLFDCAIYIVFARRLAKENIYGESTTGNEKCRRVAVELGELRSRTTGYAHGLYTALQS